MDNALEQTEQGGSEGWIRHLAFGTALEQPVPRKISADLASSSAAAIGGGEEMSPFWVTVRAAI